MKERVLLKARLRIVLSLIFLFVLILATKLFFVQVVNGDEYSERADGQYVVTSPNIFNRGSIYFSKKDKNLISAATLKMGYIIAINPTRLEKIEEVFKKVSSVIVLNKNDFLNKARKIDDPYEEIANRVSKEDAFTIRDLGISGISIHKEKWRYYPGGNTASQVLGFVGYDEDNLTGIYGLERYFNNILDRKDKNLYVNFFAEIFTNLGKVLFEDKTKREGDLVLFIEPNVQSMAEKELHQISTKWDSDSAGVIIMNPNTGAIYSMASLPNFDLNNFGKEKNVLVFSNPAVENVYEMGSIMKPITMAIALDTGAVTAETKYQDNGFLILDGSRIENYDGKGRGLVDMQKVLNDSLNTGAVFAMQEAGKKKFKEYIFNLGLGEETGIDLPGEISGLMSNLESKRDIEYATASYGQGIAVTPIGMIRALSTLGNGGWLPNPSVVNRIKYSAGISKKIIPNERERVFNEKTSDEISRMLVGVVDDALLGGTVSLPNYSVAAKTGTAQIANNEEGGYYDDRYLHSFFGYFPAYNPKFIIFLYIINPKEVRYASHTLTEPFFNLTKFLINYYQIPPDR